MRLLWCWYLLIVFPIRVDHIFLVFCMFSNFELYPRCCECYIAQALSPCYMVLEVADCFCFCFSTQSTQLGSEYKFTASQWFISQLTSQSLCLGVPCVRQWDMGSRLRKFSSLNGIRSAHQMCSSGFRLKLVWVQTWNQ